MNITWSTERRQVKDLIPLDKNPFGKISEKNRQRLREKIERLGVFEIPTVDSNNELLTFNKRYHILMALGRADDHIDVRIPSRSLTESERKEIIISSNVHEGEWDKQVLKDVFMDIDLDSLGLDLAKLGLHHFTDEDVSKVDQMFQFDHEYSMDVESGDIFELVSKVKNLNHRVSCGNSEDADLIKKLFNGNHPVLMVTDPPYGVNYDPTWREKSLNQKVTLTGLVKNDDNCVWTSVYALWDCQIMYVWHAGSKAGQFYDSIVEAGYDIITQIIWHKQNLVISRGDYHQIHEPCYYAVKKGSPHNWQGSRKEVTVWEIDNLNSFNNEETKYGHGTQKPLDCMKIPIDNNSRKGEVICDPFLGSGTSLIAAEASGRVCYANELDPTYVRMSICRYLDYMNQNNLPFDLFRNGEKLDLEKLRKSG